MQLLQVKPGLTIMSIIITKARDLIQFQTAQIIILQHPQSPKSHSKDFYWGFCVSDPNKGDGWTSIPCIYSFKVTRDI